MLLFASSLELVVLLGQLRFRNLPNLSHVGRGLLLVVVFGVSGDSVIAGGEGRGGFTQPIA